jgi:hypothetical protein
MYQERVEDLWSGDAIPTEEEAVVLAFNWTLLKDSPGFNQPPGDLVQEVVDTLSTLGYGEDPFDFSREAYEREVSKGNLPAGFFG